MTRNQQIMGIALAFLIGWFGRGVYDDYLLSLDKPEPVEPVDQSLLTPAPASGSVLLTVPVQPVPQPVPPSGLTPLRRTSPAVPIPNPDFKVPAEPRGGYKRLPSGAVNDLRGS